MTFREMGKIFGIDFQKKCGTAHYAQFCSATAFRLVWSLLQVCHVILQLTPCMTASASNDLIVRRYGKSLFFLGWHEIRETLYEALPPGVVDFGRRYASYDDQGADGVIVNFKVLLQLSCFARSLALFMLEATASFALLPCNHIRDCQLDEVQTSNESN